MSSWTKEPWGRDPRVAMRVVADGDRGICSTGGFFNLQRSEEVHDENLANAERIVACVNALSGVPDPGALLGEVREVLDAARAALEYTVEAERAKRRIAALLQRLPDGGGK